MGMLEQARAWQALGYTPLPIRSDGTKAPWVDDWRTFIEAPMTAAEVEAIFTIRAKAEGIGLVCGSASAGLEMLELEGRAVADGLEQNVRDELNDAGLGDLWGSIEAGYVERTPSGGVHWYYRVDGAARGNLKLARRPGDEGKVEVLIETRGEGGFTVVAPSAGKTHATGRPWEILVGAPEHIPTISVDERDLMYSVLKRLDQMPALDEGEPRPAGGAAPNLLGEVRPGDDFNARATWQEVIGKHGWVNVHHFRGDHYGWRRPGKDVGISATTGANAGDNLYVFSTSTEFTTEKAYSKFSAYALLEHGGDFMLAAKTLRAADYGSPAHVEIRDAPPTPEAQPINQGALATVTELHPRPAHTLAHTDDANAQQLIDAHGDVLRYCADRGRWLVWDSHVWQWCAANGGKAREYAKDVVRGFSEADAKQVAHKRKSLSNLGITAMLRQAETDPRIAVRYDQLDAHAWELNTPGGIVDLRAGTLMPADPARLHTRSTSCAPSWKADRTRWEGVLADTFGGDDALTGYLQRLVGYSAVGEVGAHILPYCHGSGGNGKGVFLETCVKVLGDYATSAPAGFLMAKKHPTHETEIARLAGMRMVLCSEVNDDDRFDEARVKQLTGGDSLTAHFMARDHFTFTPTHQLWAVGNHKPHVRSGGRAFWRRMRLIPFLYEVPAAKMIDNLQGILAAEDGPAVLSWIIDGAAAYALHGLDEPEAVQVASAAYATDQDTVARFLDECCLIGGGEHVQIKVGIVRTAYEAWCHETGDEAISAKAFGLALRRAGIESGRKNRSRMYVGLALLGDENASPESEGWFR